jgi:hypothetical protein
MIDRPNYAAMTINERLVEAGLLDAFDVAARNRDRSAMLRLLTEVDVSDPSQTIEPILNDPAKYGY